MTFGLVWYVCDCQCVCEQFETEMIVTLDQLVAAGHGDKQYQELFAEMSVYNSCIVLLFISVLASAMPG